jgi:hypothetical protein
MMAVIIKIVVLDVELNASHLIKVRSANCYFIKKCKKHN